jgi:hypothetical protein
VLTSAMSLSREQVQNQQRAMTVLLANNIPYETLDGADPSLYERYVLVWIQDRHRTTTIYCIPSYCMQSTQCCIALLCFASSPIYFQLTRYDTITIVFFPRSIRRNELFRMSGIRGNYPQFFLVEKDGSVSFLGDWNRIEGVNDSSGLPEEILDANPEITTWKTILG